MNILNKLNIQAKNPAAMVSIHWLKASEFCDSLASINAAAEKKSAVFELVDSGALGKILGKTSQIFTAWQMVSAIKRAQWVRLISNQLREHLCLNVSCAALLGS